MEVFASPSWDVDDACEDLNRKLFGSSSYNLGSLTKKDKKSVLKLKSVGKKSPNIAAGKTTSESNIPSPKMQDHGNAKKALLTELKGKLISKRKIDDLSNYNTLASPPDFKKKKRVQFNIEPVPNDDHDSIKQLPKQKPSKKKKDLKTRKLVESKTDFSNQEGTISNKSSLSLFLSKITKKKARTEKNTIKNAFDDADNSKFIEEKQSPKLKIKSNNVAHTPPAQIKSLSKQLAVLTSSSKKTDQRNLSDLGNGESSIDINKSSIGKKKKNKLLNNASFLETDPPLAVKTLFADPVKSNQTHDKSQLQSERKALNKFNQTTRMLKVPTRRQPGTLRERMMRKLQASRFRYLNEQMYCSKGSEALEYFKTDPAAFQAYHEGYRQQVTQWPLNPIDKIITALKKKPSDFVIADFGCGDAKLARSLPNIVHSFDLVAVTEEVTACDMAHTPLGNSTVDVAVFCLSLMGTNLADYLKEANRVLKVGGILKVAEVESRFENIDAFIKDLQRYGFDITNKDLTHNLFYFIDLKKVDSIKTKKKVPLPAVTLKPCLYKKR